MKYLKTYTQLLEGKDEEKALMKIKKFFKCDYVTDKAVELHPKLAIWIVNTFMKYVIDDIKKDELEGNDKETLQDVMKYFKTGIPKQSHGYTIPNNVLMKNYWNDLSSDYQSIVDWAQSFDISLEDRINLPKMSFKEAFKKSDDWHKSLKAGGVIGNEHGEVLMTFPDGFYWIDLNTTHDEDEAEAMGHCGRTNKGNTLYSLRDRNKSPHVTSAIDTDKGIIYQMKGRNNTKPISKYHKYIVALLTNDDLKISGFGAEYNKKDDFSPDDLDKEMKNDLLTKKPDINKPVYSDEEIENMFEGMLDSYYFEDSEYGFRAISWMYDVCNKINDKGYQNLISSLDKNSRTLFDILCDEYPEKAIPKLDEYEIKRLSLHDLAYNLMADDYAKKYNIQLPNPKASNSNKWEYLYDKIGTHNIDKIMSDNDINIFNDKAFEEQFQSKDGYGNGTRIRWDYEDILEHFFDGDEKEAYKALEKLFDAPQWEIGEEGYKQKNTTYAKDCWDVFEPSDVKYYLMGNLSRDEMEDEMSSQGYYEYTGDY